MIMCLSYVIKALKANNKNRNEKVRERQVTKPRGAWFLKKVIKEKKYVDDGL